MTTGNPTRRAKTGSVLLITLFVAGLLGITLGSYLLMVRAESLSAAHSQAWNAALPMAGAGVEEALAYLNSGGPSPRSLTNFFTSGSYSVGITNTGGTYTISSTGYVKVPALSATISRVVQVTAGLRAPLFITTLSANSNISLAYSGQFATTNYSPRHTNDGLACLYGILDIAYRTVDGDVFLGPTARFESNSQVSQVAGTIYTNFSSGFADVVLPVTTGWFNTLPPGITTKGTHYDYAFIHDQTSYDVSSLNGSIYVASNVNVTLKVSDNNATINNLKVAGSGNSAATLTIYMAGTNFTLNGKTTVQNQNATNLCYFGSSSNTSINLNFSLNGTTNFYGTIYAPSANVTNTGDYNTNVPYAFTGAVIAGSIQQVGNLKFHFDDHLLTTRRRYVVASWHEL